MVQTSHLVLVVIEDLIQDLLGTRQSKRTSWKRWYVSCTVKSMADSQHSECCVSDSIRSMFSEPPTRPVLSTEGFSHLSRCDHSSCCEAKIKF